MFIETIIRDAVESRPEVRRPPSALAGTWENRLGSTMRLVVEDGHHLHGSYHSGVGTPATEATFPVVGYAEGDALVFCVDFGRFGSVATWTGHRVVDDDGERLMTLWHLAQPIDGPNGGAETWRSILTGANEFHRVDA